MDKPFDDNQRLEFCNILHELARSQTFLQDPKERSGFYLRFEKLYYIDSTSRYRHYYSDIYRTLVEIQNDDSPDNGNIDTLGQNISVLYNNYREINKLNGEPINIASSLQKLYDHVSLDIARIQYSDRGDDRLSSEERFNSINFRLDNSLCKSKKLAEETKDLRNETRTLKETLDKAQTDYIAILGIFASVVLAFVGGMAFSTSVLENIRDVSIYRLLTVALIIGMVFVTVIFLMFYFVGILTRQKQFTLKTCVPLIIVYAIFWILLCSVFVMWMCGTVESRNSKITRQYESIETTETEITDSIESEKNNAAAE